MTTFNADHKMVGRVEGKATIQELEKEVGMYSATPEFCLRYGGPIARNILTTVPKEYYDEARRRGQYPNIDVRIHRLYPGNYPAYPGWHCDAQYRETYFGQPRPNHTALSDHLICTVATESGISNTEFIAKEVAIDLACNEADANYWANVDVAMQEQDVQTWLMPDGDLTRFDCWTLHRCQPAQKRGWRLFFRMAMWYRPNLGEGQLSKQEMIYMDLQRPTGW